MVASIRTPLHNTISEERVQHLLLINLVQLPINLVLLKEKLMELLPTHMPTTSSTRLRNVGGDVVEKLTHQMHSLFVRLLLLLWPMAIIFALFAGSLCPPCFPFEALAGRHYVFLFLFCTFSLPHHLHLFFDC